MGFFQDMKLNKKMKIKKNQFNNLINTEENKGNEEIHAFLPPPSSLI